MKFAVIGDLHGSISNLKRIQRKLKLYDAIFITGDITGTVSYYLIMKSIIQSGKISREKYAELVYGKYLSQFIRFQKRTAYKIFRILSKTEVPVFYTHGNSDTEEVKVLFQQFDDDNTLLHYIGNSVVKYEQWLVVGYGYSSPANYRTPFQTPGEKSLEDIRNDLSALSLQISGVKNSEVELYFGVFHEPPKDTKTDFIPHKNSHGGSELIREHITKIPYDYVFTGHIHESQNFEYLKNKLILNPGPLINRQWATVNQTDSNIELRKIPFSLSTKGIVYRTRETFK